MTRLSIPEEVEAMLTSAQTFSNRYHEPFYLVSDEAAELIASFINIPSPLKPRAWRLNAWKNALSPTIKHLDLATGDKEYSAGLFLGIANFAAAIEDEDQSSKDAGEQLSKELMLRIKEFESPVLQAVGHAPEKLSRYYQGYTDGLGKVLELKADGNIGLIHYTEAHNVYMTMLRLSEYLDTLESVAEAYNALTFYPKIRKFPHSIESFTKICYRIGFKGKNRK